MESLTSPSMDEELKRLADKVWLKFLETAPNMRCCKLSLGHSHVTSFPLILSYPSC